MLIFKVRSSQLASQTEALINAGPVATIKSAAGADVTFFGGEDANLFVYFALPSSRPLATKQVTVSKRLMFKNRRFFLGVDFDSDLGKLQRLMAESIAGTTRRNAILNEMQIQAGDTIVDIGCGAGHLLTHLAKAVGDSGTIYGLDPSEAQLEQARKRCSEFENIKYIEKNADDSQLETDSCHSVTSTQALEYVPDVEPALDEITRILKSGGAFVNVSILWDHFKFHGAEEKLNGKVHEAFRAHCSHQMLPMELPGKLERRGFESVKDRSLAFVITRRDNNSPARYSEAVMANFALTQGLSVEEVSDWKSQLEKADQQGRFGFTSFPVLTSAYLS